MNTLFTRATPGTPASVKYKWNTDSCGSYLHVIMTLRPTALHSCPYGLILSFSLSQPASSMVGFWQLLFITSLAKEVMFLVALVSLSVCLSVCLSVDNITQKVRNGLG